jgi:predicted Rossmann-fold nucleotide-binding protein
MQAANEGAALAGSHNVGIRVHLPFEQDLNAFVTEAYEHREFFSRLDYFVLVSDAFVVVPGGIGTALELSMIWQLLQVRKMRQFPLILIGKMWAELIGWAQKHMLNPENLLASADDLTSRSVTTADQALAIIRPAYMQWASKNARDTPNL